VFRFGRQLEGGHLQSRFPASDLGPGAIASTPYSSAVLYSGLTFGTKHTAFRASYGFELIANGALGADWKRYIGDTSFNFWFPLGDHRPLQIESRFTAGVIQQNTGVTVPIEKKFFGGNAQESFLEDDDWDFRTNPRSPPHSCEPVQSAQQRRRRRSLLRAESHHRACYLGERRFCRQNSPTTLSSSVSLTSSGSLTPPCSRKLHRKRPGLSKRPEKITAVANALASLTATLDSVKPTVTPAHQGLYDTCNANVRLAGRRLISARITTNPPMPGLDL
jgi:hypothetical protein